VRVDPSPTAILTAPNPSSMPIPRHPHTPPPPGPFELRFAAGLSSIRLARHALAAWLELQPTVDRIATEDLLVVCSELVTHAVEHGGDKVVLRAAIGSHGVVLEAEDAEDAAGLRLVQALTDRVEIVSPGVVRCVRRSDHRNERTATDDAHEPHRRATTSVS
jgi:anti-sigma regulatory factor (Ser/Thr protein kinase)